MKVEDINLKELIENETGLKFNRENKIHCPLPGHNEKTASFSYDKKRKKFRCFGCGIGGNAIDFIKETKGLNYSEACKYLGVELNEEYRKKELRREKIKDYAIKQTEKGGCREGAEITAIYDFTDEFNNYKYSKIKFVSSDGNKVTPYCHIENNSVVNNRFGEEVPYNLYKLKQALNDEKDIFIVEGEKDVDTMSYLGYTATSYKNVKEEKYYELLEGARINIIPDNDKAGENYLKEIKNKTFKCAKSFKVIKLPNIDEIEKGDITDWINAGHTREELKECIYNTLDLKNKNTLQQDHIGIYKYIIPRRKDMEAYNKYISNFNIKYAKIVDVVDGDGDVIEVCFLTPNGKEAIKRGSVTVFDDVRSFKAFLGSMDLTFKGKIDDLTELKEWINRYFVTDKITLYKGNTFTDKGLVTNDGLITPNGTNKKIKADSDKKIIFSNIDPIESEELQELLQHLLNVQSKQYIYSIIGTVIHGMMGYIAERNNITNTMLFLVGESGSGKTAILKNVIKPLLGYSENNPAIDITSTTKFPMIKALSESNYPVLFEEYKPSHMQQHKITDFSNLIRNLYERNSDERGQKNQTVKQNILRAPLIMTGEESFPNKDKSTIEKVMIAYLSKIERPEGSDKDLRWLEKNKDITYKLGRAIVNKLIILSDEEYIYKRGLFEEIGRHGKLKDRPLELFINACTGMEVLNEICGSIIGEDFIAIDYSDDILKNVIEENVGNDEDGPSSIIVEMLRCFDDIIYYMNLDERKKYIRYKEEFAYINTKAMVDLICKYNKDHGITTPLLEVKDFNKQVKNASIALKHSESFKVGSNSRPTKFYINKLIEIGCDNLVPSNYEDSFNTGMDTKVIPISCSSFPS